MTPQRGREPRKPAQRRSSPSTGWKRHCWRRSGERRWHMKSRDDTTARWNGTKKATRDTRVGSKTFVEVDEDDERSAPVRLRLRPQVGGETERREEELGDDMVTVEIREGGLTRRARISAPSIERALKIARDRKTSRRVRLVFPIDPETFFIPEGSGQRE